MASNFQLLLEREGLLQAEDDVLPSITALYAHSSSSENDVKGLASGSVSGGSDSERDLEQEWREALQEAIEKDIQRQVRLRLGLDHSHRPAHHPPPLHSPHTHTHPNLTHHRTRLRSQDVATLTRTSRDILQQQSDQSKERSRRTKQTKIDPTPYGGNHGNRTDKPGDHAAPPSKEMQLFQYLNSKYGTPVDQLRSLTTNGAFRTRKSDFLVGGGVHIRWPVEANIIHPTPKHTRHPSADKDRPAEPLNNWTEGSPPQAPPTTSCATVGGGRGRSVYDCTRSGNTESRTGMLTFDSRFESGNLHQAMQIGPHEYNLILRTDLYSKRHTQWFYFQVGNMEPGLTYTFHIINLLKKDSLYNYGMQPLLYSERGSRVSGEGWRRVGREVCYHYSPGYHHPSLSPHINYYTLTWKMEFPHAADSCYLAHCYPYPYSTLLDYLEALQNDPVRGKYVRKEVLCSTLAGNPCYLLTITDFEASADVLSRRRGVVLTARVHPGETNSSWMMEGVLDRLTAETQHAKSLRSHCVFKLVPMMNPDGVVVGNYRTSLAGVDLNRVYKKPIQDLFPTVYHTKQMISEFMQERELMIYVDLHGHSRKHNVFMYGCHVPQCDHTHFLNERVLPFLLSEQAPDKFCFQSCKFQVHRCKEATGRVVAWRMGVANSFTMEATFCGSTLEPSHQFSEEDLLSMGRDLCEAVYKFYRFSKSKSYQQKILGLLAEHILKSIQENKPDPLNLPPPPPQNTEVVPAPLPDIVTSSIVTSHPTATDSRPSKKHRSKHTSKALQKLMKYDTALLEAESSTSGSDSENDEFQYHRQKHTCRHRKRQRHRSLQAQTNTQLLPTKLEVRDITTHPDHTPNLASQGRLPPLKLHASAPARLQSHASTGKKVTMLPSGYRFVNRYANRSNGGIPMFAEERSKERAEKKLRSLSMIQPSASGGWHDLHTAALQPPNPLRSTVHTQHILPPMPPAAVQSTASHRALQFLWQPVDSCDADTHPLRRSHTNINPLSPESSMRHYQSIKGLVEARKPRQPPHARRHGLEAFLAPPTGHTHKHDLQTSRRVEREIIIEGGRAAGGSHAHLSPRLVRYISEIWSKNFN